MYKAYFVYFFYSITFNFKRSVHRLNQISTFFVDIGNYLLLLSNVQGVSNKMKQNHKKTDYYHLLNLNASTDFNWNTL